MVLRIQSKLGGGKRVRLGQRPALGTNVRTLTDERIEAIAEQVFLAVQRLESAGARPSPGPLTGGAGPALLPMQPRRRLADAQRRTGLRLAPPPMADMRQDQERGGRSAADVQARPEPRKARRDMSFPMDGHRLSGRRQRRMPDVRQMARLKAAAAQGRPHPVRQRSDGDRQQAEVSTTGPPRGL
ncbi:hypothetical protein [Cohnella sp. JJ-181]|uniref:hypothetical protein n=1 Tax=Cohnella rhizoplanae TaxID=2974897 RepID=UPI0022FFC2BE|nr:hypothetical protein [Cohnella sp. JJ-181]CAI6084672.1 hypothetical protein COHCIP112018_04414 [Cohnella sp. JJ-181]